MSKTVNFIEAVNSGKRFKPVGQDDHGWMYVELDETGEYSYVMHDNHKQFMAVDLINDQFKLEEKSIIITESEFDEACKKYYHGSHGSFNSGTLIDILKKEIGF